MRNEFDRMMEELAIEFMSKLEDYLGEETEAEIEEYYEPDHCFDCDGDEEAPCCKKAAQRRKNTIKKENKRLENAKNMGWEIDHLDEKDIAKLKNNGGMTNPWNKFYADERRHKNAIKEAEILKSTDESNDSALAYVNSQINKTEKKLTDVIRQIAEGDTSSATFHNREAYIHQLDSLVEYRAQLKGLR